jgi:hypothetical protein
MAWIAVILILLSACSSEPTANPGPSPSRQASSPAPTASPTTSNDPCAVGGQTPPSGNIAANFATALTFAPDGRLFWTERAGTVKVWQDGAAFIDSSGPSPLAGHLVFCTLNGGMRIVTPASPHASVQPGPAGCLLDVKEGPDHAVYFSDTTTIFRVS